MASNESNSDFPNICPIEWPKACLKPTEDVFLTVCCGNTTIGWAMHSASSDYDVFAHWKTPQIADDNDLFTGHDHIELLDFHLKKEARLYIFGSELPSREAAEKEATKRGFDLTVYLMGSVSNQVETVSKIISSIPCRVFLFQRKDFFLAEEGMYDTIGIDRLATLRGAAAHCGFPALVIDGGTCLTYTAADGRGHVIGGGISPGIHSRLKVMTSDAPALPEITMDDVMKRIQKAIFSNLPIPLFARDTKDAMIVNVLSDLWHSMHHIIQSWLERMNASSTSAIARTVFITGGCGDIIRELLGVNREKIIDVLKNEGGNRIPFKIDLQPCLVHKGMVSVILKGSDLSNSPKNIYVLPRSVGNQEISEFASSFVKKKVANKFKGIDLVGTVTKVTQVDGDYLYHIRYESGYEEMVNLAGLKTLIDNFHHMEASSQLSSRKRGRGISSVGENSERMTVARKSPRTSSTEDTRKQTQVADTADDIDPTTRKSELKAADSLRPNGGKKQRKESADAESSTAKADARAKKAKELLVRPRDLINLRVMKYFVDEVSDDYLPFYGTIDDYEYVEQAHGKLWHITYDDGDGEHCDENELLEILKQYKKHRDKDPSLQAKSI